MREWISSMTMKRRSWNSRGIAACLRSSSAASASGVIWRMPEGCFGSFSYAQPQTDGGDGEDAVAPEFAEFDI